MSGHCGWPSCQCTPFSGCAAGVPTRGWAWATTAVQLPTTMMMGFGGALYPGLKIKHEGIRVGEIEAWRIWRLVDGKLYSMTTDYEWLDGVAHGDIAQLGVYCWKNENDALQYASEVGGERKVIGTIAIWGEIVEHEYMYRAEHARIVGIKDIILHHSFQNLISMWWAKELARLRKVYNVQAPATNSRDWTGRDG